MKEEQLKIERVYSKTHEKVLHCTDPDSGLHAFVAIHDTTLGPALGGCRMWNYPTAQEALADALRLSAGMTAKSALAGVPFGGGKAVIMGDSRIAKTPEMMRAFGRFVESLEGQYISGEDVGISPADMMLAAQETDHIVGLPEGQFASGDPSPITAELVFRCTKGAAAQVFGAERLDGRTVAIQGLGHVGMVLAHLLHRAGAQIVAADRNAEVVERARQELDAAIVAPEEIHRTQADILAPCALGGVLNARTIPEVRAKLVCGSANNQLTDRACAQALQDRGITYCPDFVVNSGGLISVAREALRIGDPGWTQRKLDEAEKTFAELMDRSRRTGVLPQEAADEMVAHILEKARKQPRDAGHFANPVRGRVSARSD